MGKAIYRVGLATILVTALAWAQATPKLTGVEPATGKVGESCTVSGENLGKDSIDAVLLSDEEKDYPAEVVEQTAEKVVMKIPVVKAGSYNVSIQVGNAIYIQPIRFTVQE